MPADEARRRARLALGGVEQAKELHRDARSFVWLDDARRDVSYAVRMLRRNPIVAATVVLSIAVGIGANTAVFTVANALLFRRPAGVLEADRLVDIGVSRPDGGFNPGSFPTYLEIRRRATTLDGVYARQMFPQSVGPGADGRSDQRRSVSSRNSSRRTTSRSSARALRQEGCSALPTPRRWVQVQSSC